MSNNNCIGPTNIIPNNNQVVLQDVNRTITVIDNNCCTNVEVTQPITSVVQVLTGPMGPTGEFPTSGSFNLTGSFNVSGSITANSIYSPYFSGSFFGNGNGIFSGSFSGSLSANLQDITNNGNVTTLPITASSYYGNGLQIVGNAVVTGSLTVSGSNTFKNIGPAQFTGSLDITGSGTLNGYPLLTSNNTSSLVLTSSFNSFTSSYNTGSFSGSLSGTASYAVQALSSSFALTASYALNVPTTTSYALQALSSSYAETASIVYVTSSNYSLSEIEVQDYSNDVAVTFNNGRLKFIFGVPVSQSISSFTFNGTFLTDRFNKVLDIYTASATWANNGYNLIAANIFENGNLLATTSNGTTLDFSTNESGSHTYLLQVTASSPLDSSIKVVSSSLAGTLSKSNPGNPTLTVTPTVQLGASSNQIEQGATGSISFISASGTANSWVHNFTSTNVDSPVFVTGSATGSSAISITATSYYSSSGVGGSDNNPPLTTTTSTTTTYTKIRSVRYASSATSSFTQQQIENLSIWASSLGATEITGSIAKGTIIPNNYQFTINTTAQYIYIIIDSSYTLTGILNVNNSNANDINVFTSTVIGNYRVYRSNNLSSTSILYKLTS